MSKRWLSIGASALIGLVMLAGAFVAGHELQGVAIGPLAPKGKLNYASLNDVYGLLKQKFDGKIDDSKALDGAKAGLVTAAGDPYTVYLDAKSATVLNDDLAGQLSGIGAELAIKNQKLVVVAPIAGAPAEKAGLRAGDNIIKIDGTDASDLTLDQAVGKIRGKKDTAVKLTILRGITPPIDLTITRAVVTLTSVKWSMKPGNIAYIAITSFGEDTTAKIAAAAIDLKAQGATKVILDLRNNPGGYLDAGVAVASQFLPEHKLVVEERRGSTSIEKLYSAGGGNLVGIPMVVLINNGSASASEIVAGALADNGAAKLVGQTSFGKGSVQDITKLGGGAEIKITIAHWYTPNGKNIGKAGIRPDVSVDLSQADYDAGRDPQLDKALDQLK